MDLEVLKPYQPRAGKAQDILPPPELIDDKEEYEVEEVLAKS